MRRKLQAAVAAVSDGEAVVWPSILAGIAVAVASLLIGSHRGDVRVDVALASMAAFLFGVILAFTIVRTRERLALVQDLVARDNSALYSIHQLMPLFGEPGEHVRPLIDQHLTDQIDFRLVDYHLASASNKRLIDAVYALQPSGPQQESVYKELVATCINMTADRANIEAATGQALSPIEWNGLLLLLLVLDALIAVLPGGTIPGALVAGVLAGTLVTFMVVLRKLDLLRWHEVATIWEPTARLFRNMGFDPYVPRDVIASGRYRPSGRVRVVEYPDPYPMRASKIVKVEELNGKVVAPAPASAPAHS